MPVARSALLTILGEYVAPVGSPIYRDALVGALEAVGYKTNAARQAVARSVAEGWLTSARVGRRARLTLTGPTQEMLSAGYPRIYQFGTPWEWDGHWLLLVVRVPEERRAVRDRLRSRLAWAGFGSLGGGVWISPQVERLGEAREALDGDAGELLAFTARQLWAEDEGSRVISQAWDLEAIAAHYRGFIEHFSELSPSVPAEIFAAQTALVHTWRKLPFLDPDLPQPLLPADWPQADARAVFHERHHAWREPATAYFTELSGAGHPDTSCSRP